MPTRYLKAIPENGRRMFVLLAEWLRSVCGATVVDDDPAPAWVVDSGSDGATTNAQPTRFVAASGTFTIADVNRYLVVYGATQDVNNGLRKIVAVPNGTTVIVQSGVRGQPFTSEVGLDWKVIDPAVLDVALTPAQITVIEGQGTSPAWQLALTLPAYPSTVIEVQAQPLGNWNTGTHAPTLGLTSTNHEADTTPLWWWRWDGFTLTSWTENNAATAPHRVLVVGSAGSFHPANDPSCVVQANAALASIATTGSALLADDATVATARFLVPTIAGNPVFTGITPSPFDLRNDGSAIPFGAAASGAQNELRGVLSGLLYVSTGRAYKTFVTNTRTLVSLGGGYGVLWDGSLVV